MKTNRITLPSFAKINWFLRVFGRREDGFHELCTAFQTVSLNDDLVFTLSTELKLTCDQKNLPTDENNLILKSAIALKQQYQVDKGARIHLKKRIPSPAGLGGGSSNAAVTLLALATLWELPVNLDELVRIGGQIGSDVPYFLYGGTALGAGRGTEISPARQQIQKYLLIVTPNIDVSTAGAFSKLDARRLTKNDSKSILQNCYDYAERLELGQLEFFNDFEKVIFQFSREIRNVKEKLLEFGAKHALLAGSGASVFGVFDNEKTRQTAFESFTSESSAKVFSVETVSQDEYREFLKPCDSLLSEIF